jgi:hypothetical protein
VLQVDYTTAALDTKNLRNIGRAAPRPDHYSPSLAIAFKIAMLAPSVT